MAKKRKQLTKQITFRVEQEIYDELVRQARLQDDPDIDSHNMMARSIVVGVVTRDDPIEQTRNRLAEMKQMLLELRTAQAVGVAALLSHLGNVDADEAKAWAKRTIGFVDQSTKDHEIDGHETKDAN